MIDYPSIYPCVALQARGRIGQMWIHKDYKTFKVVTKYYYPSNPQTALQQANRALMAQAVQNWQGFDVATKQFYNSMLRPTHMSGYNRYIQKYLLANEPVVGIEVNNVQKGAVDDLPTNYDAGSGDNRRLVVIAAMAWADDNDINWIRYNNVNLTRKIMREDPWGWGRIEWWYLDDPAEDINSLTMDTDDDSVCNYIVCWLSNVELGSFGNTGQDDDEGRDPNVDITPSDPASLIIGAMCFGNDSDPFEEVAGTTLIDQEGGWVMAGLFSQESQGGGSQNLASHVDNSDGWAAVAVENLPAT